MVSPEVPGQTFVPEVAGQLLKRIRLGERADLLLRHVQFAGGRMRRPSRASLADDLAALANGRGGECLLGVDDESREILGIPAGRLDRVARLVGETCWEMVEPPLDALVEALELPDACGERRAVARISVGRSLFVHRSPGGYLRRSGDSGVTLSPGDLARLVHDRSRPGLPCFDETIVDGASFDDLDQGLVDRFRHHRTEDDRETVAATVGLVGSSDKGPLKPTLAGVLLASERPEIWHPNAFIQATACRGTDVPDAPDVANRRMDALDCHGPLDRQVADACRFVARNRSGFASETSGGPGYPQYDMTAVSEALVNAVAHRDYSVHGPPIRLRLFPDRLEVQSPGAPSNGISLATLACRQASRNITISGLLARCPTPEGLPGLKTARKTLMKLRGEGVSFILRRSEELSGQRPLYELLNDRELRLTIFAAAPSREAGVQ